jgi:hypothetical protein
VRVRGIARRPAAGQGMLSRGRSPGPPTLAVTSARVVASSREQDTHRRARRLGEQQSAGAPGSTGPQKVVDGGAGHGRTLQQSNNATAPVRVPAIPVSTGLLAQWFCSGTQLHRVRMQHRQATKWMPVLIVLVSVWPQTMVVILRVCVNSTLTWQNRTTPQVSLPLRRGLAGDRPASQSTCRRGPFLYCTCGAYMRSNPACKLPVGAGDGAHVLHG